MRLRDLFRRREPEEGDELDGCALDFTEPYDGPPVEFEAEPEAEAADHGA